VGLATTYFDCCKPHCGWEGKGGEVIKTCGKDRTTVVSNSETSLCQGGTATTCLAQYPFLDPTDPNLAYFTAAGFGPDIVQDKKLCGKCFELTFQGKSKDGNSDGLGGKRAIIKFTNTGSPAEYQNGIDVKMHTDLLLPGGGEGLFHGCSAGLYPQFGGYTVNGTQKAVELKNEGSENRESGMGLRGNHPVWGLEYGGVQTADGCAKLPPEFQEGCKIKFEWGKGKLGAENLTWWKEVPCPKIVEDRFTELKK
jgi:hypothetical protein